MEFSAILQDAPELLQLQSNYDQKAIIDYYDIAGMDYKAWSRNFNMHFGYFRWGMNPFSLEKMLQEMNQHILQKLQISPKNHSKILDMGCGVGAVARSFAQKLPKSQIIGITIVESQVTYGNQLSRKDNCYPQVEIVKDNYENSFFEDQTFEYAYAIESSCYGKNNKADLIKEMYRLLKSDGKFVIADGFRKHAHKLPSLVNKAYQNLCESWALPCLANVHDFAQKLKDAGFKEIEVKEISWRLVPSVAFIPFITAKFLVKEFWKNKSFTLKKEQWNNLKAPLLTMWVGLYRKHFGYFIIRGRK